MFTHENYLLHKVGVLNCFWAEIKWSVRNVMQYNFGCCLSIDQCLEETSLMLGEDCPIKRLCLIVQGNSKGITSFWKTIKKQGGHKRLLYRKTLLMWVKCLTYRRISKKEDDRCVFLIELNCEGSQSQVSGILNSACLKSSNLLRTYYQIKKWTFDSFILTLY